MAFKTLAALALAAGLTQVSATCQRPTQTEAGFNFILTDSPIPNTNNKPLQLRPSKDGQTSYLAIDNSSPALKVNFQDGALYALDSKLVPTGQTGYLANYQIDPTFNPPTTVGTIAFANVADAGNATDINWILDADSATHWSLWRQEPANTYNGVQICEADFDLNEDGSAWYYFQYVDWQFSFPQNCQFLAMIAPLAASDGNSC